MELFSAIAVGLLGSGGYTLIAILVLLVVVPIVLIVIIATAAAYLQQDAEAFVDELEED